MPTGSAPQSVDADDPPTDPDETSPPRPAMRRWSPRELFRRRVPDDFVEFVGTVKDDLRNQCDVLTGHEELAEVMRRDLLASVALRWQWWRLRRGSSQTEAATGLLQRSLHREERTWPRERERDRSGPAKGRWGRSDAEAGRMRVVPADPVPARPDRSAADLAAIVWSRARRIRATRTAAATAALLSVAILAAISPRLVRELPPAAVGTTAVPAGVLLVPAYDQLAALPTRGITLPANLDIGSDAVPLAPTSLRAKPPTKVLALLRHADGLIYAFVPDGTVRVIDNPELTGPGAQLYSTSLSPDGLRAVFPSPQGLFVLDVTTGSIHEIVTGGPVAAPVWRGNRLLMAPNFSTALQIDVDKGTIGAIATSTGMDVVAQEGGTSVAPMLELLPANASPRLRLWHVEPDITSNPVKETPPVTDVEDRPIFGPPWIGRWSGPAYANGDLLVRGCGPDTIALPSKDGLARSCVGALAANGLYIATLVGTDQTVLELLGMIDSETVLINAVGDKTSTLLAWAPRQTQLQRVSTVSRTVVVSVADASTVLR